jgi:hypothetical protein
MPANPNLGDKPYSLDALGAQLDPKTHQEWKEALNARAEAFLKGESGMGSTFRRNATRTITDLLYRVEPNEVQQQQTRIDTALAKLKSQLGDVIASEDYCTQGIGPAGTMVDVPRGIAHQLKIDLEANTLGTPDGIIIWRVVTVRMVTEVKAQSAPAASINTAAPYSPRKRGVAEKDDSDLLAKVRCAIANDQEMALYAAVQRHCGEKTKNGVEAAYKRVKRKINRRK